MSFLLNNLLLVVTIVCILVYLILSSYLETDITTTSIIVFSILFILNIIQYVFNIDINTYLVNWFSPQQEIDVVVSKNTYDPNSANSTTNVSTKKQVFNVPGNNYTYTQAKAVCKAYDSDLATYKQIEEAYESGAEWCNYGWSDGQLALFPTQQNTYDNLKNIPGHEHDCGRPGVNGGYIANDKVRFGVNCYGTKPPITPIESDIMANRTPYPYTKKDIAFQAYIEHLKNNLYKILVSPFNYKTWSE